MSHEEQEPITMLHSHKPARPNKPAHRLRRLAATTITILITTALALLGLGTAPASAATIVTDGWLTGTVTGPNGEAPQFRDGEASRITAWDGDMDLARPIRSGGYGEYGTLLGGSYIDAETGEFVIEGLPAGRVKTLEISDEGLLNGYEKRVFDVDLNVTAGAITEAGNFQLRPTGQIKLKVLDADGLPVSENPTSSAAWAGVGVVALDDAGNKVGGSNIGCTNRCYDHDTGVLTFRSVNPGHVASFWFNYDYEGSSYYAFPRVQADLQVDPGAVVDGGTILLPRAGSLTGQVVTDATGFHPVERHRAKRVVAFDADGTQWGHRGEIDIYTGKFKLGWLPPGVITRLEFRADDESVVKSFDVDIAINAKRNTEAGTFQVSDGGFLRGKISDPVFDTLDPDAQVNLIAYDQDGKVLGNNHTSGRGRAYAGSDSWFFVEGMEPGRVKKLRFHDYRDVYADKTFDVDIEVLPGVETSVDAPFVMSMNTAPRVVPSDAARAAGPVRGVSGVAGSGRVDLSWSAPVSDGGALITDYLVQYQPAAGGDWVTVADPVSSATSATITGLTNGTGYVFRVAALNSAGVGGYSPVSAVVTPGLSVPAAAGVPVGVPGDGQVQLSWAAPEDDGGSPITGYKLRHQPATGGAWTETTNPASTTTTITGLTNGTTYVFQVAAINSAGQSPWSPSSTPVTPAGSPAAPTPTPTPTPPPAAVAPQATPAAVEQTPAGSVPAKIKAKGKKRRVKLPKRTNAGQAVNWTSTTPKVCKVVKGKLKLTGKRGTCKLLSTAPPTGDHHPLQHPYTIRIR
ncbi:MAG: fibronectin type III domain-containing protein [Candidatus Nanopelagicales bacterium]|nr:fibronectin type III domain-containing protein [Candidatus Nanopelagicales bacterium]